MSNNFSERLVSLRNEFGITQEGLAKALNVSLNSIYYYENGKRVPNANVIIEIAQYFNVTTDYLLGLTNNMTSENTDIGKETGLSDKAIYILKLFNRVDNKKIGFINFLIEQEEPMPKKSAKEIAQDRGEHRNNLMNWYRNHTQYIDILYKYCEIKYTDKELLIGRDGTLMFESDFKNENIELDNLIPTLEDIDVEENQIENIETEFETIRRITEINIKHMNFIFPDRVKEEDILLSVSSRRMQTAIEKMRELWLNNQGDTNVNETE